MPLLVLAAPVWADESADRAAITGVILALNKVPRPPGLFEENADASVLDRLWSGNMRVTQARILPGAASADGMTVSISHEPWGEARIGAQAPAVEMLNPRFIPGKVQFVAEVALADGEFQYTDQQGATQTTPLLFVMKREGASWKIAAVRRAVPASP